MASTLVKMAAPNPEGFATSVAVPTKNPFEIAGTVGPANEDS